MAETEKTTRQKDFDASSAVQLVTGASGHVGYAMVTELLKKGVRPKILIRKDSPMFDGMDVEKLFGDVTDPASLERAFEGVDIVYHFAGIIDIEGGQDDFVYDVNVNGTKNVVKACKKKGVKCMVYSGSVDTYPPLPGVIEMTEIDRYKPEILEGTYARTKAIATQYVLDADCPELKTVVVQPTACIGPYDFKVSSVGVFVRQYMAGSFPVSLDFGMYNFVDVRDVAKGAIAAAEVGGHGECYILGGKPLTVDEFIHILAGTMNKPAPGIKLNKKIIDGVAPLAELYYRVSCDTPLLTRYSVRKLDSNCNFSIAKAQRELGYEPTPLEDTIRDMMIWIINNEGDPSTPTAKKNKREAVRKKRERKFNKLKAKVLKK